MTSVAASKKPLEKVKGIVFFGFPLHPAGTPSDERAEHLNHVNLPMLFLQGTRDKLADLSLLKPVIKNLGDDTSLEIIDGADHSFHVLKSSGFSDDEVVRKLAKKVREWGSRLN